MINIYGHIIDETQVIGVGPLIPVPLFDNGLDEQYFTRSFHFNLYLTAYKIEISTNNVPFDRSDRNRLVTENKRINDVHTTLRIDLANRVHLKNHFAV